MKPAIYYNINDLKQFVGKSFKEIYETTESLRKRVKEAAGYNWDNSHFFLQGISGNIISLSFSSNGISAYNDQGSEYILSVSGSVFSAKDIRDLEGAVYNYAKGLRKCNECKEWVGTEHTKRYSFAGVVCVSCYKPAKHAGHDTRGD